MEEIDRINIQTTSSEEQTLQTVVNNGPINLTTQVSDVPQIQTVMQENVSPISSVINNPFVEVTSVNGMTGDVITEAQILGFIANKFYKANTLISYNGNLYWAKQDFTSGSSFNNNDWNQIEATGVSEWDDIQNKPNFATVATSGLYNDLSNKPNLASVATSGSYNDLSDKPSINNGSLTIKRNNTLLGTFTANSSSNVDVNVSVPVRISDLTNDDNYLRGEISQTISQIPSSMSANTGIIKDSSGNGFYPLTKADVTYLQNNTTVETAINNLKNAGYIAQSDIGTITAQNLASNSVTYEKVNWDSVKPVWSTFVFTSDTGLVSQEIVRTTKLGRKLTFTVRNGGSGLYILSGGEDLEFVRQRSLVKFTTTTDSYGVMGVASGSTVWTYATGGSSGGTYFNASARPSTVASGSDYTDLAGSIGGNKAITMTNISLIRTPGTLIWFVSGKMHSSGSAAYVDFQSELTASSLGCVPTTYQRGAQYGTVTIVRQVIEVLEYE